MKPRRMTFALIIAGILVAGLLLLRHAVRTAGPDPTLVREKGSEAQQLQPVDKWQRNIRFDARPDYTDAIEKLRKEERRQRPEEGRN